MDQLQQYIETHKDRFISELCDLLRIPSVSADPKYKPDVQKAAELLAGQLKNSGAEKVEILPTPGHPVIYAERIIDPALPTVLVYGHYDVQPPDPLDLWKSGPFEPQIRDGKIYARGAADDKGQVYMHVKAFEFMHKTGQLPCNIKFMIEGEEEVGSENLAAFLKVNRDKLKADIILISDTSIIANETPSITVGLRGLSYVEVELTGPNRDLHSGLYGGAVTNPLNALCEMIAELKDENGKITIPGFYDKVQDLSAAEREEMARAPFDEEEYKNHLNITGTQGEKGYSTPERASIRPTLDVNGIWGGYIGEGAKTVIPSKAFAKISMRLVPDQDPDVITGLFADHFKKIAPPGIQVVVKPHHGGRPVVTSTSSAAYIAASKAMETTFGKVPVPVRGGGSVPIVATFSEILGLDSVLMGFGLDSDAIHSPNESFGVWNFLKGIETIPYFFLNFSRAK